MPDAPDLLSLVRALRQQPAVPARAYPSAPSAPVDLPAAVSDGQGQVNYAGSFLPETLDRMPAMTGGPATENMPTIDWTPLPRGVSGIADMHQAAPEPLGDLPSGGFSQAQATKWQEWRNAGIEAAGLPPKVTQYMENNEDYGEGERTNQVNPNAPPNGPTPPALIWPRSLDSRQGPALKPQGAAHPPGMTEDWFHNYQPGATGPIQQISDLLTALRAAPPVSKLLSPAGQASGAEQRKMPGPGFIPGTLNLNAAIAPKVPEGAARPFAPGEHILNPDGSWSSEETVTVSGDQSFNGGQPTVLPSLWVKDGKAYVTKGEDEATALAKASGLTWPSYPTMDAAENFANAREKSWQGIAPQSAGTVPPLWTSPDEYIEPPPKAAQ